MSSKRNRSRPTVEMLEDRVMPATRLWDGGGTTNLWTDRFNWQGDLAPTAGDDLVFGPDADPTSLTNTNDFGAGASFNSIAFNDAGYTLQGNGINLGVGGVTYDVPGASGQNVIALGLTLAGTRDFNIVQGGLDDALLLTGVISGTGGVIKVGAGSLGLDSGAASNTYSSATNVTAGTLRVHSDGALGSAGNGTTVQAGAVLELANNALTNAESLTLNGGTLRGSSNSRWDGDITLQSDSRIEGATAFVIAGDISGGAAADLNLVANIFLDGANTYAGFTTIERGIITIGAHGLGSSSSGTRVLDGGVLNLGSSVSTLSEPLFLNGDGNSGGTGALTLPPGATDRTVFFDIVIESDAEILVASGGRLSLAGSLSGVPTTTLSKTGGGELRYAFGAGEPNTFTGVTEVNGGTLTLSTPDNNAIVGDLVVNSGTARLLGRVIDGVQTPGTGNNQISDAVTVFVASGGLLDLNDNSDTVGGLILTGGAVDTGSGTLTLNGDVTTNASSAGAVINGRLNLGAASRTFNVANGPAGGDLVINAVLIGASSGNLIKDGTGAMTLSGANFYLGQTIVNAGSLNANNNAALGSTSGNTTVNAGASLRLNSVSVPELVVLNGAGVGDNGALFTTVNSSAGAINLASDATISVGSGATLSVSSVADSVFAGGPTLTKIGVGTLAYVGTTTNSFDGITRVHDGTLLLDKAPDDLADLVGGGALFGGALVIGDGLGGADRVLLARDNQIADTVGITINAGGVLNLANNDETVGALTLAGGIVQTGAGLLTLDGDVTVDAAASASILFGNLSLGVGPTGQPGVNRTFTVADGGFSGSDLIVNSAPTSVGVVNLVKRGTGTLEIADGATDDAPTYLGTTSVLEGTLLLNRTDGVASVAPQAVIVGDATATPGTARLELASNEQITSSVAVNRSGIFDLNGRTETINQLQLASGQVDTEGGTLSISALSSSASDVSAVVNGKLALQGASSSFFVANGTAVQDVIVNADVTGGLLVKIFGTGTLVLNGNNVLSGMQAGEGTILVNGSQPGTPVTVDALDGDGATLGGDGGSSGAVTVSDGTLAPGGAPGDAGLLTIVNGLGFSGSAGDTRRLEVDLNASPPSPGVNHDQVVVLGAVNLGNKLTNLVVNTPPKFIANAGASYVILSNDGTDAINGRFIGLADEAPLTINGQAFRIDYQGGDGNDVALIRNTAATIEDVIITPEIDEGGVVRFTGRLTDPDAADELFVTLDWGDGSAPQTLRPGRDPFTVFHRYRDDDPSGTPADDYIVTFTWGDGSGETRTRTALVRVNNVAPSVVVGAFVQGRSGQVRFSGFVTDPGDDRLFATIDFGDGSGEQVVDLRRNGSFTLRHRYAEAGTYTVTLTVSDDDGGVTTRSFSLTVRGRHNHSTLDALFAQFAQEDDPLAGWFGRRDRHRR